MNGNGKVASTEHCVASHTSLLLLLLGNGRRRKRRELFYPSDDDARWWYFSLRSSGDNSTGRQWQVNQRPSKKPGSGFAYTALTLRISCFRLTIKVDGDERRADRPTNGQQQYPITSIFRSAKFHGNVYPTKFAWGRQGCIKWLNLFQGTCLWPITTQGIRKFIKNLKKIKIKKNEFNILKKEK